MAKGCRCAPSAGRLWASMGDQSLCHAVSPSVASVSAALLRSGRNSKVAADILFRTLLPGSKALTPGVFLSLQQPPATGTDTYHHFWHDMCRPQWLPSLHGTAAALQAGVPSVPSSLPRRCEAAQCCAAGTWRPVSGSATIC